MNDGASSDQRAEQALVRKVSWRLVSYSLLLFVVAAIDRTNVGFAALEMNRQLGIGPAEFGFAAGIFFIGYAAFEMPSNYMLSKVGARRWISRIMISWGIVVIAMAWIQGATSFYVFRFLLGVAEAGFLPGILFYLGHWVPPKYRARTFSILLCGPVIANMLAGPIAAAILSLDGVQGFAGWRLLFIIEGIPAIILGVVSLWVLTESPSQANWLSTEEKSVLARASSERGTGRGGGLQAMLRNRTVWQLVAFNFFLQIANYGVNLWLPQIIRGMGQLGTTEASLLSSGPYLLATAGMIVWGIHSDRTRERRLHMVAAISLAAVGLIMCALFVNPVLAYVGICLAAVGITSNFGVFWAVPGEYIDGRAGALGLALISSMGQVGGFVGPYVVGLARAQSQDFTVALLVLAGAAVVGAIVGLSLSKAPEPKIATA